MRDMKKSFYCWSNGLATGAASQCQWRLVSVNG